MGERVIADVVPFGKDPPHEIGIGLRVLADDEKARTDALLFQDIENLWCPIRIGTVVEGERKLLRFVASALNDERGRDDLVDFIDDLAGLLVDVERTRAWSRFPPTRRQLALSSKSVVLLVPDTIDPPWGRGVLV